MLDNSVLRHAHGFIIRIHSSLKNHSIWNMVYTIDIIETQMFSTLLSAEVKERRLRRMNKNKGDKRVGRRQREKGIYI